MFPRSKATAISPASRASEAKKPQMAKRVKSRESRNTSAVSLSSMCCSKACLCVLPVAPVMERVSGNVVDFDMSSLTPATLYTVKVYAVRDLAKSAATTTEFSTGEHHLPPGSRAQRYRLTLKQQLIVCSCNLFLDNIF